MMKISLKNNWSMTVMVFTLFILIFLFQINLTTISKLHTIAWEKIKEVKVLSLNSVNQQSPYNHSHHRRMISCNRSSSYDVCSINSPTIFDPIKSTFYLMSSNETNIVERLQPYPRKWDSTAMTSIKNVTITSDLFSPLCSVHHNIPALVFSVGGYTGNFFHDISDGFIPLFITNKSIFHDQEYVMVIANLENWWVGKYADLLTSFTKHPLIDFDHETVTHCFPSAHLGLIKHGPMTIDPKLMPNSESIKDFRAILQITYNHNQKNTTYIPTPAQHRPLLVILSRGVNDGRAILNERELQMVANKTGFRVIVFKPRKGLRLADSYALLNSSHAMLGVHGAALTHLLYLRPGAVFIQIIPLGLKKSADEGYGNPAKNLGLDYLEYKIDVNESSLSEKYNKDSIVIKHPEVIRRNNSYKDFMKLYLKEQNVRLDLVEFRKYLNNAYEKAQRFMNKNG